MKSKRIICAAVAVCLLAALGACSKAQTDGDKGTTAAPVETTTAKEEDFDNADPTAQPLEVSPTRAVYDALFKDVSGSFASVLCEFTTAFNTSLEGRSTNLRLAADIINNTVVPPGQTFSFNQVVGKRTALRGYKTAKVVVNGEFDDGLGGGVCQVSSTLFNAAIRANMTIVERSCHSLKVTYVPTAFDAAVQWTSKDFQFKNSLDVPVQIKMFCSGNKITAQILTQSPVDIGEITFTSGVSNGVYSMSRLVNGKVNYTTTSKYKG